MLLRDYVAAGIILLDAEDVVKYGDETVSLTPTNYVVLGTKQFSRILLDAPSHLEVDHKNRNRLDYRRDNLRIATVSQNKCNRGLMVTNVTGYKGVHKLKSGLFRVSIMINHRAIFLGSFTDVVQAAKAYDAAARIYHGEFAYINFPEVG